MNGGTRCDVLNVTQTLLCAFAFVIETKDLMNNYAYEIC